MRTCENCYAGYDPDEEGADGVCGQCAWDEDDEQPPSRDCNQEQCPMWDGHTCPCATFGLDKDDLPTSGVYSVEVPDDSAALDRAHNEGTRST